MLVQRDIQRRFDRAADGFDAADFVHTETREGLIERLQPLVIEARTILDLGAATGSAGHLLRQRFRRARIVSLDLSHAMLRQARRRRSWFTRPACVQADANQLPFADGAFDLVIANQLLPWIPDPDRVFAGVARVLKPGGVFAFATLGPDSLREIAAAWAEVDDLVHVNRFADMHDIGDGLVRAGLKEPVLDVDRLSVSYENPDKLWRDLTSAGARNTLAGRARGLVGRRRFRRMLDALRRAPTGAPVMLELELVYGHCWGAGPASDPAEFRVAAEHIPLRR
jgi:malonyl-CoA O-methyltransferase